MKKIYLLILLFSIGVGRQSLQAQINDNPFDVLVEKLYQNELLSNRFLRNFAYIKTNTFKKKALIDMDKSLALFDDNMSYIILHLPYDRKVKDAYLKLENYWNIYRISINDYESDKYKSLVIKTRKLDKLITQLNKAIINKHKRYSRNSKAVDLIKLAVENGKNIDKMAIAYVLSKGLHHPEVVDEMLMDSSNLKRNLKKIAKYKPVKAKVKDLIEDLNNTIDTINELLKSGKYNPKMMYAYNNAYSHKTFKLLKMIIQTIQ